MARRWEEVRDQLSQDWEATTLGQRRLWEEVEDDVRFGWQAGMSQEFRGAGWPDVEDILQRRWEERYPHARFEDWRSVGEAARLGFERAVDELREAA